MSGIAVARLLGVEVRIHLSWAIVLAVIAVTVADEMRGSAFGVPGALGPLAGAAVAALFLGSAIAHELAHALVARRSGMPAGPIVVYFFGGTGARDDRAARPRDEIASAVAGPLTSIGIGLGLVVVSAIGAFGAATWSIAVGQVALMAGLLNLVLGGVNLVPAYPLDGGRIVRGLSWWRTGDPRRATRMAARSGRIVGLTMVAAGMVVILTADTIDGLMFGICGWFLTTAARQVDRRAIVDELLDGLRVDEVMDRDVPGLAPGLTVDTFAGQMLDGSTMSSLPVVGGGEFLGVVGASQVRRLRRASWSDRRAGDVMVAAATLPVIAPETPLRIAYDDLGRTGLDGLPVVGSDGLAGVVTRRAILEALHSRARVRGVVLP